jgi:hypothetical protein
MVHSTVCSNPATHQTSCVLHSTLNTVPPCTLYISSTMPASTAAKMCPQPAIACN